MKKFSPAYCHFKKDRVWQYIVCLIIYGTNIVCSSQFQFCRNPGTLVPINQDNSHIFNIQIICKIGEIVFNTAKLCANMASVWNCRFQHCAGPLNTPIYIYIRMRPSRLRSCRILCIAVEISCTSLTKLRSTLHILGADQCT